MKLDYTIQEIDIYNINSNTITPELQDLINEGDTTISRVGQLWALRMIPAIAPFLPGKGRGSTSRPMCRVVLSGAPSKSTGSTWMRPSIFTSPTIRSSCSTGKWDRRELERSTHDRPDF